LKTRSFGTDLSNAKNRQKNKGVTDSVRKASFALNTLKSRSSTTETILTRPKSSKQPQNSSLQKSKSDLPRRNFEKEGVLYETETKLTQESPSETNVTPQSHHSQNSSSSLKTLSRSATKSISSLSRRSISSSISGRKKYDVEFSVQFTPGPLGMNLEPVIRSMDRELGCRVVEFVNVNSTLPSQARLSRKIHLGDVITSIDGKNMLSKPYDDIIALLKNPTNNANGRTISFRRIKHASPKSRRNISAKKSKDVNSSELSIKNSKEISPDGSSVNGNSEIKESTRSSSFLSQTPSSSLLESEQNADLTMESPSGIIKQKFNEDKIESSWLSPEAALFSPSNVRKLTTDPAVQTPFDDTTPYEQSFQKPIDEIYKIVTSNVVPLAGAAIYNTMSATNTIKDKVIEALLGFNQEEFENAMLLKRQLLTELSLARAALGEEMDGKKLLQNTVNELVQENKKFEHEKEIYEAELHAAETAKGSAEEKLLMERDEKHKIVSVSTKRAQETVTQATQLAAHNSFLRSQTDLLKEQFKSKEWVMTERVLKIQRQLDLKTKDVDIMQNEISKLNNLLELKDEKIKENTDELVKHATNLVQAQQKIDGLTLDMNTSLSRSEKVRHRLLDEQGQLRTELSDLNDSLINSKTLEKELGIELEKKTVMIENMHTKSKELELAYQSLESDRQNIQKNLSCSTEKIREMELRLSGTVESNLKLQHRTKELESKHERSTQLLEKSKNEQEEVHKALRGEIQMLSKEKLALEQSFAKQKKEGCDTKEALLNELLLVKKAANNEKEQILQEKLATEEQAKLHLMRIFTLQKELEAFTETNSNLKTKNKQYCSDLQEMKKNILNRENEMLERLNFNEEEAIKSHAAYEKKVNFLTKEIDDSKELVSKLSKNLEMGAKSMDEIENSLRDTENSYFVEKAAKETELELKESLQIKFNCIVDEKNALSCQIDSLTKTMKEMEENQESETCSKLNDAQSLIESMKIEQLNANIMFASKIAKVEENYIIQIDNLKCKIVDSERLLQQKTGEMENIRINDGNLVKELNSKLKSSESDKQKLQAQIQDNEEKLKCKTAEIESIRSLNDSQVEQLEAEIELGDSIRQQLQLKLDEHAHAIQNKVNEMGNIIEKSRTELDISEKVRVELLLRLEESKVTHQQKNVELDNTLQSNAKIIEDIDFKLKMNENIRQELQTELDEVKQIVQKKDAEINEITKSYANIEDEYRTKLETSGTDHKNLLAEHFKAKEKVAAQDTAIQILRNENHHLISSKKSKIIELEKQVSDFEDAIKVQNIAIKEENAKIKAHNKKLAQLLSERESELNLLRDDILSQTQETQKVIEAINADNASILVESKKKIERNESELDQMKNQFKTKLTKSEETLHEVKLKASENTDLIQQLQKQLEEKEKIITSMSGTYNASHQSVESINELNDELNIRFDQLRAQKQTELSSMSAELESVTQSLKFIKLKHLEAENRATEYHSLFKSRDEATLSLERSVQALIEETTWIRKNLQSPVSNSTMSNTDEFLESASANDYGSVEILRTNVKLVLEKATNECNQKQQIIKELESHLVELEGNMLKLENYISEQQNRIGEMTNSQKEHNEEMESLRKYIEDKKLNLMESVKKDDNNTVDAEKKLQIKSVEAEDLEVKLEEKAKQINELQNLISLSELESISLVSSVKEKNDRISNLQNELGSKNERIRSLVGSIEELKTLLKLSESELKQKNQTSEALRTELRDKSEYIISLSEIIKGLNHSIDVEKKNGVHLVHNRQEIQEQLDIAIIKIGELESDVAKFKSTVRKTKDSLLEQESKVEKVSIELASKMSIIDTMKCNSNNLESKELKYEKNIAELEKKCSSLKSTLDKVSADDVEKDSKITTLKIAIKKAEEKMSAALDLSKQREKTIADNASIINELNCSIDLFKSKELKYQDDAAELKKKCSHFQASLEEISADENKVIERFASQISKMREKETEREGHLKSLTAQIVQDTNIHHRQITEAEEKTSAALDLVRQREKDIADGASMITELTCDISDFKSRNLTDEKNIAELEKKCSSLKSTLDKVSADDVEKDGKITTLKIAIKNAEEKMSAALDLSKQREKTIADNASIINELNCSIDLFKSKELKYQDDAAELESKCAMFQHELDKVLVDRMNKDNEAKAMEIIITDAKDKADAAINLAGDRKNAISRLQEDLDESATIVAGLNQDIEILKIEKSRMEEKILLLENTYSEFNSKSLDRERLIDKISEMEETVESLRRELSEKENQIEKIQRELGEKTYVFQQTLEEAEAKASAAVNLASDRKHLIKMIRDDLEGKTEKLDSLNTELESLKENYRKSECTISNLQTTCSELRTELSLSEMNDSVTLESKTSDTSISIEKEVISNVDKTGDINNEAPIMTVSTYQCGNGTIEVNNKIEKFEVLVKSCATKQILQMMDYKFSVISARAFRKWSCAASASQAVENQLDVAEEMSNQLETTSVKLAKLKSHLALNSPSSDERIIETLLERPPLAPFVKNLTLGQTNNSFWDFSDSESEDSNQDSQSVA